MLQSRAAADLPPGVTQHAIDRQHEHWGSQWSRAAWAEIVLSIVERRAVLRRVKRENGKEVEFWWVASPDGPATVIWFPRAALVLTVLGPAGQRERGDGGGVGSGYQGGRRDERRSHGRRIEWDTAE